MIRSFATAAALLAAAPALAQSPTPTPQELESRNSVTAGLGVGFVPDYEGSDDYRIIPAGGIRGQYNGFTFSTRGLYLYVDVLPDHGNVGFDAGPIAGVRLNRTGKIKDNVVDELPELNTAIELGGFVGINVKGVTNPYDTLAFRVDVTHDVGNAHGSTIISPNIDFSTPLSRSTFIGASVGMEFVGNDFADYYYSITPADSLATAGALPVFDADGGLKNWKASLLLNHSLSGDLLHGFSVFGILNYSHLGGDFKKSPIVDLRGSASQWIGALGVAYTW